MTEKKKISRRKSREKTIQILYSLHINKQESLASYLKNYQEDMYKNLSIDEYLMKLINGINKNINEINDYVEELLSCSIDEIAILTLCILKLAIYEIKYENLPPAIACNEAVEITKKYMSLKDADFVNAILRDIR